MSEKFLLSSVLLLYIIAKHVKPSKGQVVNAICYAVSSITLPLVEGFLEKRSIRATKPLLCLWILIIALQHRTKRYLHSKESAKRPQILLVFRSTALQRRHISTSCSQCEMSTFWEWGLGPRDQNTYHLIHHFAFGAGCSSRENSSLPQICKCKVPGRDITAILQGSQSSLVIFLYYSFWKLLYNLKQTTKTQLSSR